MIQIKKQKDQSIAITDKIGQVILNGSQVTLNELVIEQSGEYEDSSIEVIYGHSSALIVWENLQLVYVFEPNNSVSAFEKNEFTPCHVLIIDKGGDLEKGRFTSLTESFDPNFVLVTEPVTSSALAESFKFVSTDILKVSDANLPQEGRDFYFLP